MNEENKHTYDNGFHPRKVTLKENYKFYNRNILFLIWTNIVIFFTVAFVYPMKKILWGYRIKGKENLKGLKGAITISNHCLQQDAFILVSSLYPKKTYVTMLESNLGFPIVSQYLRYCGAVPIPTNRKLFVRFLKETKEILEKNKFVHIYPEAALMPYCDHIREFMPGAFHIAYNANAPIVPIVYTFHNRRGLFKLKKKPSVTMNILQPYYIDFDLPRKEAMNKMNNDLYEIMSNFFNENSELKQN